MKQFSFSTLASHFARCASLKVLWAFIGALLITHGVGFTQTDNFVRITSVDSIVEGQAVNTPITPNAIFLSDLNETVTVTFDHRSSVGSNVQLLEDGVVVDEDNVFTGFTTTSQLSYVPSAAGISDLTVVFPNNEGGDGEENLADSISLQKIGISLNTPLPNELIPAGSRFFVEGSTFLPDSFVRNLSFYVRAAPGLLRENMPYLEGDKVTFQGRIYEVANNGLLATGSIAASAGLNSQDRSIVTSISGVGFRYAGPNLVEGLDYHEGDFVLSNDRLYRVSIAGRLDAGAAAGGLSSSLESEDDVAIVEFLTGRVGFQYDSTPSQLTTGQVLQTGDFVRSGSRLYEVLSSGVVTSSPAFLQGTDPSVTVLLDGIELRYRNTKQFRSNAPFFAGELVVSGDHIFEVVVAGTVGDGAAAEGLAAVSAVQFVTGRVGFVYVADEVDAGEPQFSPRQYHKYTRVGEDNADPFTVLWGPADVVADPRNWFGPDGYFENSTTIELFALVTDSKDFARRSVSVPVSVLPAIDPGAIMLAEIIDPLDGRVIAANTEIQISAQAKDAAEEVRTVRDVQFFVDGIPLDVADGVFPYTNNWTPNRAGTYVLNVVATDFTGNRTTSPDIRVNVTDNRPFVELRSLVSTSFNDPRLLRSGDAFTLSAFAVGSGGSLSRITSVSFFSDGNLIGNGTFDDVLNLWVYDDVFGTSVNFEPDRVYTITALATDANLLTAQSIPEFVRITPTIEPVVTFVAPIGDVELVPYEATTGDGTATGGDEVAPEGATVTLRASATVVDGTISQVEFFYLNAPGNPLLGTSIGVDTSAPYTTAFSSGSVGTYYIYAVATSNTGGIGVTTESIQVTVAEPVEPVVTFVAPTAGDVVEIEAREILALEASAEVEGGTISGGIRFYFRNTPGDPLDPLLGTLIESVPSAPYTTEFVSLSEGVFYLYAVATSFERITGVTATPIEVRVTYSQDEMFINNIFDSILGRSPTDSEVADGLDELDGSLESQTAYVVDLLDSSALDDTDLAMLVNRTMLGEWPDAEELAFARANLSGGTVGSSIQTGSIEFGATETFEFFYNVGDAVTMRVTQDSAAGNPLRDATLTVNSPSGAQVGFSDDSIFGLDPLLTFTVTEAGTHTAIVGGFSLLQSGDFTITSLSTGSGSSVDESALSLVTALIPEFESRFRETFPPLSVAGQAANDLVTQLFRNKHSTAPSALALSRLSLSLTGVDTNVGQLIVPGYSGSTAAFVAAFALDNQLSQYPGLSSELLYSVPNDATKDMQTALLIATLLDEDPTDAQIAEYAGMTNEEVVEAILIESLDLGSTLPEALSEAVSQGGDWYYLEWIGSFAHSGNSDDDWIYSMDLGWLYIAPTSTSSGAFLYSSAMGSWLYGSSSLNHFFYHYAAQSWVFVARGNAPGSAVFFYNTNTWVQVNR